MKIKIEIDLKQRYSDVSPFFDEHPEAMEAVIDRVVAKDVQLEGMEIKDLCEILDGRIPKTMLTKNNRASVGEVGALVKGLRNALERFASFMENTTPPMTSFQKRMTSGMLDTTSEEAILLTCKDFYNLHSLEEAQRLSVYEYMIARKSVYNDRIQAYNVEMDSRRTSAANRV